MLTQQLWIYPIKGLRGIPLPSAELGPQGLRHDRAFTICRVLDPDADTGDDADGSNLQHMQLVRFPQCALFHQELGDDGHIHVRYQQPEPEQPGDATATEPADIPVLRIPLEPDTATLPRAVVNIHQSMVQAYRVGPVYDAWFSARFGFPVRLLYIGDARRPILGTMAPGSETSSAQQKRSSWSLPPILSSLLQGNPSPDALENHWLRFSDCAPYLVASESSLADVAARMHADTDVAMVRFRPNIVVDGEGHPPFDEDFWSILSVAGAPALVMTKMCGRCASLNVDYRTGTHGTGDQGAVLKRLMRDRRVDTGARTSPVFGRYAFLHRDRAVRLLLREKEVRDVLEQGIDPGPLLAEPLPDALRISVGDDVAVDCRHDERPVWDWPIKDPNAKTFYPGRPAQAV